MYRSPVRIALLLAIILNHSDAQNFSSGPIPICDMSCFTAYASSFCGAEPPGTGWGFTNSQTGAAIKDNHPPSPAISVTSPTFISLFTVFNSAGGCHFTGCIFNYPKSYGTAQVAINRFTTPAFWPDQTANGCSGYTTDRTDIYHSAGTNDRGRWPEQLLPIHPL